MEDTYPEGYENRIIGQLILLLTPPFMKAINPFFKSYNLFFQRLREGKYQDFTSALEADPGGE